MKISAFFLTSDKPWREAMERKSHAYSPKFKYKVALAALQSDLTLGDDFLERGFERIQKPRLKKW